jgi:biotin carboxyl carrier protein
VTSANLLEGRVAHEASQPEGLNTPPSSPIEDLEPREDSQGEILILPMRFVVAPDHGRFHPSAPLHPAAITRGALIGELRNHTTILEIHSPFGGRIDLWLVSAGQIVTPGQPLCSLHTPTMAAGG